MVQGWLGRLPWQGLLLVSLLALSPFGCIHLHNQAQADLAKETAGEFKKFQDSSSNIYVQMLGNLEKVDQAMVARQAEVDQEAELTFGNQVSSLKWGEIEAGLQQASKELVNLQTTIEKAIDDLLKAKAKKEERIPSAKKTMEDASNLLKKAVKEKNEWEARAILFRSTIKFMADNAVTTGKKPSLKALEISLENFKKNILEKKVTLEGQTKPLGEWLGDDMQVLKSMEFKELLRKYSINLADPLKAPGLTVTILSLGLDLAQAQFERARLEVNYLAAGIELIKIMKEKTETLRIDEALTIIRDRKEFSKSEKVLKTLDRLRYQVGKERAIQHALEVLAIYGVTQTLDINIPLELKIRTAMLKHKYSIQVSVINAMEHEALIGRGLQGLVTYHEGGLKPETIANLLRAAQMVAVAVISAGVN